MKKYAINDGPGIRVVLFFKGCPLHCAWCHNPESISSEVQKMYNPDKCIGCRLCVENCPEEACALTPEGIVTDMGRCTVCGLCAEACPPRATEMSGYTATVAELVEIALRERVFIEQSGGGVTISGGEPLRQHLFLRDLLDALGERGLHRAVDTSGFAKTEILLDVARRCELFLYDLKLMDGRRHRQWTGVDNELILANLTTLAESGATINIRIPLIKGVNDDDANLGHSARFIAALPGERKQVNVLPYHNIATGKYRRLGVAYDASQLQEPDDNDLARVKALFAAEGLEVIVGG
ncbi:MAG: glycyl-radical enzyme activating protein [Desulfopila sp.]